MTLKKIIVLEITAIALVLVGAMYFVQINPFLESSKQDSPIGLLNERVFPKTNITLERGQTMYDQFNYTSYEPPILILDITYLTSKSSGYLTIYCNGRFVANVLATQESKGASLTVVSSAGMDWVKPQATNAISFVSEFEDGYEGMFSLQIKLRGSR